MAHLGFDIRDLFKPSGVLTPRYCLILVGQLPEDSATVAAHRGGPEFRAWTSSTHLLAAIVNLTNAANRQRGGKRSARPIVEPPKRVRRRTVTVAELMARQKTDQTP